jgi:pimeloyl-ACP methyl ester carboxylesterase
VPHRLARLVLLAGLAEITGDTAVALAGFAQALEGGALDTEGAARIAAQRWLGPTPPAGQIERIRDLFVREGAGRLARQLRRAVTATARAPRSGVPTRLIAIADDVAVPRVLSEELATHLGVPREVWPGASHFPHWDDAAAVARALASSS